MLHVPGTKTDGSDRMVEVMPPIRAMLAGRAKERAGEERLFPRWTNVRRALISACARAGIASVSPNDLRRTFATWLAEAGVPEMTVAQMMGHTSSAMVRRVYARIGSTAKAAAAAKLPPIGDAVAITPTLPAAVAPVVNIATARRRRILAVPLSVSEPGASGGLSGRPGQNEASKTAEEAMPRDGIEPPTRGFSTETGRIAQHLLIRMKRVKTGT